MAMRSDCSRHPTPLEGLRDGAQPTLLDNLAALGVDESRVGVSVAEVHSGCHLWLFAAIIVHEPNPSLDLVHCMLFNRVLRRGSAFTSYPPRFPPQTSNTTRTDSRSIPVAFFPMAVYTHSYTRVTSADHVV
jgi:hypothetical protein